MARITSYREEFKTVSRPFNNLSQKECNYKNRRKILMMPGKPFNPFIRGGIRWLVSDERTELTCELIENSKLIFLKEQTYAFDIRGKTVDGTFKIEYGSDLLSKGVLVSPSNGSIMVIKKHRIIPLILITGAFEDYIEGRDVKTFFKLSYVWEPDSSDFEDDCYDEQKE